jgi:agmatine/peptidylarginine deiminase
LTLCSLILLMWLLSAFHAVGVNGQELPVNPEPIPEYDSVAAVVMYWNPGSNNAYDQIVTAVINGIQGHATVYLQTNNDNHRITMTNTLTSHGVPFSDIVFIEVPGERIWIRDHGPFSVYDDGSLAFVGFNDLANSGIDENLPERLAEYWNLNYYDLNHITFDGGNYLIDSHRRLFATERIFTNNSGLDPQYIRQTMKDYLGLDTIITLRSMPNDYWGHIDMQIKLLDDTTFIISSVPDNVQPLHDTLQANYQQLRELEHPEGKTYRIRQIPNAQNLLTYINSLIVNDLALIPIYNHPNDNIAFQVYEELLPGKIIQGIDCNAMIHWEGAIHCITNQLPPFEKVTDPGDEDPVDVPGLPAQAQQGISDFSVYPNPARELAWIKFGVTKPGNYELAVLDPHGREIHSKAIAAWETGNYTVPFEVSHLTPGTYTISIVDRKTAKSTLLIVP